MADNLIQQYRQKYPQYQDLSDQQLADGIYKKFYADMPRDQFDAKIGLSAPAVSDAPQSSAGERFLAGLKHGTEVTGRALIEGATAPFSMVGDAANGLINLGIHGVNSIAGTDIPRLQSASQGVQDIISPLDKPANMTERVLSTPIAMMASVPASAGAAAKSGLQYLAPLAENIPQQMASAFGSGAALGATKEVTDNPLIQAGASLAGGLAGGAAYSKATQTAARQSIPTNADLKAQANAAYKAADDAGVIIKPEAVQNLGAGLKNDLAEFGYHPQLQPKVATFLDELDRVSADNITSKQVQILRRMANSARMSADPSEQSLGKMIVGRLDGFMENIQPQDVLQGDAQAAADQLRHGAQLWKQYRKSQMVDTALDKADLRAASTGSGGNLDNATRQNLRSILDNPKMRAGFTADELSLMEKVVRGTAPQNALRLLGKMSPQGNGLMGAALGASAITNPLYAIPYGVGAIAKPAANMMTQQNANALSQLIRAGGTQEALQQYTAPTGGGIGLPDILYRSLLNSGRSGPGQEGLLQLMARPGAAGQPDSLLAVPPAPEDKRRRSKP